MPVALRPSMVSIWVPDGTVDAHGWAEPRLYEQTKKVTCSVQEMPPASDGRASEAGGHGPHHPRERRRATVYMDDEVQPGDVLVQGPVSWLVTAARPVPDPTGDLLSCWVIDATEYEWDTPPPKPDPQPDPEPLPDPEPAPLPSLLLDLYATNFVRLMSDPLLDDGQQHTVVFALATTPGVNGVVFPDVAALAAHGSAAVWFDHGGALGHVKTASGADLTATLAARYMNEQRTIDCHINLTDASHPLLQIDFARLPPVTP